MPQNLLRCESLYDGYLRMAAKYGETASEPVRASLNELKENLGKLWINRQELVARDFSSDKRMENGGILYVFPVFHSAWMAKKISFPAADDLFRVSLELIEMELQGNTEKLIW